MWRFADRIQWTEIEITCKHEAAGSREKKASDSQRAQISPNFQPKQKNSDSTKPQVLRTLSFGNQNAGPYCWTTLTGLATDTSHSRGDSDVNTNLTFE